MDIAALAAELAAGHPDTGAYNADDALAAGEINVLNRPGDVTIADLIKFLLMDNVHSTDGDDTQDRAILTRMRDVVAMATTPTATARRERITRSRCSSAAWKQTPGASTTCTGTSVRHAAVATANTAPRPKPIR